MQKSWLLQFSCSIPTVLRALARAGLDQEQHRAPGQVPALCPGVLDGFCSGRSCWVGTSILHPQAVDFFLSGFGD